MRFSEPAGFFSLRRRSTALVVRLWAWWGAVDAWRAGGARGGYRCSGSRAATMTISESSSPSPTPCLVVPARHQVDQLTVGSHMFKGGSMPGQAAHRDEQRHYAWAV